MEQAKVDYKGSKRKEQNSFEKSAIKHSTTAVPFNFKQ
ncbi:hypothetical protein COLO4_16041 [Corchorus olitorius]|uniref:Uncharacterized protein n=1 Tax=Corchorus olitorius TaxID=93759 RepID=A0A1R3JK35_9ROSI|nr:hypothetical protein COLO4_16041 [Corchorus olitorius]